MTMNYILSLVFCALLMPSLLAETEVTNKADAKQEEDDNIIKRKPDVPVEPKEFSAAEVKKACARFNGRYVSVFGQVRKVDRCLQRTINNADLIFTLQQRGVRFEEVDPKVLAPIPEGESIEVAESTKNRSCNELNGRYVTLSYTDIYVVEKCHKRLVPDYETFLDHKRKAGKGLAGEVLALTQKEFDSLQVAEDLASVVDDKKNITTVEKRGFDLIPVDEACRKVEGKYASFYSRFYKIEKCRKREIDAEKFSRIHYRSFPSFVELTPEQWQSLPEGKPF